MFVGDEVSVEASFAAASRRLAALIDGNALVRASHGAWGEGLARVGPAGPVPGLSKLVHIQFRELAHRGGVAVLTLRWQAAGPACGLFPVLDADLTLVPHGENATLLGLAGVYGPPPAPSERRWTVPCCTGSRPQPPARYSIASPRRSPMPRRIRLAAIRGSRRIGVYRIHHDTRPTTISDSETGYLTASHGHLLNSRTEEVIADLVYDVVQPC